DIKPLFTFGQYFTSRLITTLAMIGVSILYVFISGYTAQKAAIVLAFCAFKFVDVIEDIFHGHFQQQGRLDVGGMAATIRYIVSFIIFFVVILCTHDLLLTCIVSAITSFILFLILNLPVMSEFGGFSVDWHARPVFKLLAECFPLFLGAFLYLYICNSPKFAIDANLSQEAQAYFGVLFMPVFVINLLSSFIYRPLLNQMAIDWNASDFKGLYRTIKRQLVIILLLTVICVFGGYFVGIPLLEIIYGLDLGAYRMVLAILMIGGGLAALTGFLGSLMTVIRRQTMLLIGYAIVAVIAYLFSSVLITRYYLMGAAVYYVILLFILALLLCGFTIHYLHKQKTTYSDQQE
ncbi:MAG: hypothetical protein Q4E94_02360, partial [Clostridia bacterium]|nr:hypothetical protein [Clostridia bacterium]